MKKFIAVSLFALICFTPLVSLATHSSVDRGSVELGVGNVAQLSLYLSDNYDQASVLGIGLTPNVTVGYFFIDGLMLGASFGYFSYKDESMNEAYTDFDIMPLFKYYFPVSDKFLFNIKGFMGIYREKDVDYPDNFWSLTRFGGGLAANYMIVPQLGCNLGVDFTYFSNWKYEGEEAEETSDWGVMFVLGLGVYL
jgi:hypothetical protein